MDINKIVEKIMELDALLKENGFRRSDDIEITTVSDKPTNFSIEFHEPSHDED